MTEILDWTCGLCWSFAYVAAIIIGFRHKAYCIPRLSICMNLSWEFWVVVSRIQAGASLNSGFISQLLWLTLDLAVLASWILYDRQVRAGRKLITFLTVFLVVWLWAFVGDEWFSSVFAINFLMSIEFLLPIKKREFRHSKIVSVFKLIGTAAATVLNGFANRSPVVLWLGGCCLILDAYYLLFVFSKRKEVLNEKKKQQFDKTF